MSTESEIEVLRKGWGILTDLTRCIGCERCVAACREVNDLPKDAVTDELNAYAWTVVERRGSLNIRRQCLHCLEPACVSVCPIGALEKVTDPARKDFGAVIYHTDRCFGCRYCMVGCPFGIPKYQWDRSIPLMQKCILCFERRLQKGEEPACTAACPAGATIFGRRDELLVEARRRIAENPGRYVNHIYGEDEAGGTSVLYLSPVPFEDLGFKVSNIKRESYPLLTWNVLNKLPTVVSVGGVLLAGIWWISNRREDVEREEGGKRDEERDD